MNAREQFLLDRIKESMDSRKEDKEKFLLEHLKESINANQKFPRVETRKKTRYILERR